MGRQIVFSVLLGSALLLGTLPALTSLKGWKALLPPLLGVSATLLIWNFVSVHLPR